MKHFVNVVLAGALICTSGFQAHLICATATKQHIETMPVCIDHGVTFIINQPIPQGSACEIWAGPAMKPLGKVNKK